MMLRSAAVMAGLALGLMSGAARAAIFDIDFVQTNVDGTGSLTGTLTTTKDSGALSTSDISSYNLNISFLGMSGLESENITPNNSYISNANFLIIGTELLFTFTQGAAFNPSDNANVYALTANGGGSTPSITFNTPSVQSTVNYVSGTSVVFGTLSTVPLPSSAPMFGAALMALGTVGYGLKRKGKAAASI